MPLHDAFAISAIVSFALVGGYVRIVSKGALTVMAVVAQAVYLVFFSYTFFIPGLTGLAITLGAVATLGSAPPALTGPPASQPRPAKPRAASWMKI